MGLLGPPHPTSRWVHTCPGLQALEVLVCVYTARLNAPPAPGYLCLYFCVGISAPGHAYPLLSVSGYMTCDGSRSG